MPILHPALEYAGLFAKRFIRLAATPVTLAAPHLIKRRLHVYGVSLGKSGTHSLAGIFRRYRAAHEPENDLLIPVIVEKWDGWSRAQKAEYVRQRDRRLWLEVETSHLLHELTGTLVTEFPEAKFILTIRDVYSWLDSSLNQRLNRVIPSRWKSIGQHRASLINFSHTPQAQVLADHGARPLETMLVRWASHHRNILNTIPSQRLLVICTYDLERSGSALAKFLNIPEDTLDMTRAHLYKAPRKSGIVSRIEPDYLQAKVTEHCGDLMHEYFPHIKSLDEALAAESTQMQAVSAPATV
jgi:hypothetical protein